MQCRSQSDDIEESIVDEEEECEVPPPPNSSVTIRRSAAAKSIAIHIAPKRGEKYHLVKNCTGLSNAKEIRTVTLCGTCGGTSTAYQVEAGVRNQAELGTEEVMDTASPSVGARRRRE